MHSSARNWMCVACVIGALAVILGAFGAHAVPSYLVSREFDEADIARRLSDFETGARYHMYGALFLLAISVVMDRLPTRSIKTAAWAMVLGSDIFASVLYLVALVPDEMRSPFGRFAPLGGFLMIVAWIAAAVGAVRK